MQQLKNNFLFLIKLPRVVRGFFARVFSISLSWHRERWALSLSRLSHTRDQPTHAPIVRLHRHVQRVVDGIAQVELARRRLRGGFPMRAARPARRSCTARRQVCALGDRQQPTQQHDRTIGWVLPTLCACGGSRSLSNQSDANVSLRCARETVSIEHTLMQLSTPTS